MTAPRRTTPITVAKAVFRALFLTVRAVFAAAVGAAVLGGIPYTLIRFIGWPLPHQVPSLSQLKTDLTSPILGDQFYINAVAIVLWFLWAMLAVSVLVELGAQLRRVPAPHLPAMGPAQQIAATLLLAIGITALLGRTAAPARADTSTLVPKARTAATAPTLISTPTGLHQVATIPTRETVHRVVPGDSLYKIAQEDLGNGEDWPALYKANAGVVQHDGQHLTDPNLIQPGWDITIPGATAAPATAAPAPASAPSASAPAVTAPANAAPAVPTTTPSHITPSSVPVTPTAPALATPSARGSAPAAPAQSTDDGHHTAAPTARSARSGAAGSGLWIELAGGGMIAASTLLALRAAAARRHKLRALWTSPYWPRPGERRTLSTEQMPPALLPARTIALTPADPDAEDSTGLGELDAFGAPTDAAATAEPLGTETPASHEAERDDHVSESHGLDLSAADGNEDADEAGNPAWIPVAVTGDGGSLDLADLPGGLGLTGPGALGTARAIAATVLGSRSPDEFGSILLIPRADAALLLDLPAAEVDRLARDVWHLRIADDLPAAIDILAEHAAARAGILAEYSVADFEALGEIDDLLPDPEPVVLLAVARGALDTQAKTVLNQPETLRLHSVLLGEHPIGANWRIDADGEVVSGTDEPEVFAFDLSAAGLRSALDVVTPPWDDRPQVESPDPHGPLAAPNGVDDTPEDEEEDGAAATEAAVAATPLAPATPAQADDEGPAGDETQSATDRFAIPAETGEDDKDDDDEGAAQVNVESQVAGAPAILDSEQQAQHLGPVGGAEAVVPLPSPVLIASRTPTGPPAGDADAELKQVQEVLRQFGSTASQIRVLGPLSVATVSGPVDDKIRKGSLKLAALLGLHHDRGRSTEELSVLWPDATEAKLPHTRKNDLQSLRLSLKRDVLQGRGTGYAAEFIPRRAGRYRLDPHFVGVDLAAFEQLRALAARTHQPEVRMAAAEAALSLYRGELLEGMDEHWAIAPRAAVRRDALATATLLAQLAAAAGDDELALSWWERARQIDDNEEVYRQIMLVQGRLGRRADIIATRDLLEQRLDALGESAAEATNIILAELLSERRGLPRERAA